jgi:hypothetical protein
MQLFKLAMKHGGIGTAITIVLTIAFFFFDMISPQWVAILVMLGVLIWGQLTYRRESDLAVSYGESFGLAAGRAARAHHINLHSQSSAGLAINIEPPPLRLRNAEFKQS